MEGHHLIMGTLYDVITGVALDDTHDERYRQSIARLLVYEKGYPQTAVHPRQPLIVSAGERRGKLWVDFTIAQDDRTLMVIRYGPGSLVTRQRPALAISRLITPYQVPVVVVTNGEDADILDGETGDVTASGLDAIPSWQDLINQAKTAQFTSISSYRAEMEARIAYAFEIDGACPCDTDVCRLD
ncbi:type I restriction enzyme HsdR N-terminal domain-containing protein [Desulfosarcina sp. OttesenSCG-928-A07]|nr:type I restriction enzyme HsdR N-terminal domain-containing protein [Desulfosarcina sp. OttesenSCG-928-A07]